MALLFLFGGILTMRLLPRVLQEYGAVPQGVNTGDDAAAVIAKYGRPDADTMSKSSPEAEPSRVLTYGELQIVFVERQYPAGRVWKLLGFLDVRDRSALSGDEALKRLAKHRPPS